MDDHDDDLAIVQATHLLANSGHTDPSEQLQQLRPLLGKAFQGPPPSACNTGRLAGGAEAMTTGIVLERGTRTEMAAAEGAAAGASGRARCALAKSLDVCDCGRDQTVRLRVGGPAGATASAYGHEVRRGEARRGEAT
ncbi:hypothetical protein E4U42_003116 [Claviceps africana]|uniref:Uncharacterized protein n=1 Tax=Claviceps africana TaxID=83212 RepID=A0A8K0J7Q9_9HYPO|nr:hypothetical protein E4U42_003116 [Claviceps africana]